MPRTHPPYPAVFKAEAVRLARNGAKSLPALAADLGVSTEALRSWLRQADVDTGTGPPGALTTDERDATLSRLTTGTSIDGLANTDYIVEAIVEHEDTKRALFSRLDTLTRPHVILSSNTSSISITTLGAATRRPDKVLGMHFMNPVPLMTLVELIRGQATSSEAMGVATALCQKLGKTPVEAADYPGFISNRILMPMINEAIYAVMEGVGTPEAIDTVMKLGMNHPMGPLTLADFIGLDVCLAILNVLHEGIGDPKYRPCPLLRRMVAAGHLGRKSGQGFYKY